MVSVELSSSPPVGYLRSEIPTDDKLISFQFSIGLLPDNPAYVYSNDLCCHVVSLVAEATMSK